ILAEAVIDRLAKRIDPTVLWALLRAPEISLADAAAAEAAARTLTELCAGTGLTIEATYDPKNEAHLLSMQRMQHGNLRVSHLDADFFASGDYAQIRQTAQVLQGLLGPGA